MKQFFSTMCRFFRDEEGVTVIEYGLIAALIALAVVVTVVTLGTNLNTLFARVANCIASATAATCT